MSEEQSLREFLIEGGIDHIYFHLTAIAFAAAAASGSTLWAAARARHILHTGNLKGPVAVIQTTSFDPSGISNPETHHEFRDQKIWTEEQPIRLTDIFTKEASGKILKYFDKAAKLCTPLEPSVFQHLDKVIPEKDREVTLNIISTEWKNYFSGLYRDTGKILATKLGEREVIETQTILPLLVWEEGAKGWHYRVLLLNVDDDANLHLPSFKDTRFLMDDGSYAHDLNSRQIDRHQTLAAMQKHLASTPKHWLVTQYGVELPTGRTINVPEPAALPAPAA